MMGEGSIRSFLTEGIQKLRIAVLGDVMLDSYFYGEVKRISPEAPVPVTRVKAMKSVLGGAANVAANLAGLDCKVYIGGVIGADENQAPLEKLLDEAGIDHSGLVKSPRRRTITKLRVLGGQQQMLRLDFEETGDLNEEETAALRSWFEGLLKQGLEGLIISDYAKGLCSDEFTAWAIASSRAAGIPVLVDPKGPNWQKYAGCSFITPNVKEMGEAAGRSLTNEDEPVVAAARQAQARFAIENVVVTRSEKGMTLVNRREVIHAPATAVEVFDVSGAGDTVAATLLAAIAGKLALEEAVYLANRASGLVVAKVGTYPVHREELLADVLGEARRSGRGYRPLNREETASLVRTWKEAGETVVFTNGCFDLLHPGHVTYLEKAKTLGKHLIVGLNSDASVRRLKGPTRPLVPDLARARVLSALACVDAVVIFEEDTPLELIKLLRPDILVKGGDYSPEEVVGREWAGRVEIMAFEEGYSTSNIVAKIAKMAKEGSL